MTTDPADRLTRAAAKLRESDDPFWRAVADWVRTAGADLWAHGPLCCAEGCTECDDDLWQPHVRHALAVADVVLGESFQQAARDLADIKQDGEPEPVPDECELCGLPTPCVWCNT